jgi:hypothetical protein
VMAADQKDLNPSIGLTARLMVYRPQLLRHRVET